MDDWSRHRQHECRGTSRRGITYALVVSLIAKDEAIMKMMHPARSGGLLHKKERFAHPVRNVSMLNIDMGMKIADFGAGSGAYVLAIAEALRGSGTVYAIDIQKDLLRRIANEARRRDLRNVEVLWGDLEMPHGSKLGDNVLELVLISNLLFQIQDKKAVVREAARILRTGGRLVIIDWSESFGGLGPIKEDVVTKEDAYALARTAELTFAEEFNAGAHHYGLVFRKTKEVQKER